MSARQARVAVVHPVPSWHGGAEVVALWTLQALAHEHQLTLISYAPAPDLRALNRRFGTSLDPALIEFVAIPSSRALFRLRGPFDILWRCLAMAHCRRLGARFDLFVSSFYELDFGRPGVQYCHCPMYGASWAAARPSPHGVRGWLWEAYRQLGLRLTGVQPERLRQNLTLANSDWTGRALSSAYGTPIRTLYPPVQAPPAPLAWSEREARCVCIGRLVPEKRFDAVVRILDGVRALGHDLSLELVVSAPDPDCARALQRMARERAGWLRLHWNLSREQVLALCARSRYGIHAREGEHFGLAPAELAAAGAIVFVHQSGGQVEIADDPRLWFADEREAVQKLHAVLSDPAAQAELRAHLGARVAALSPARFMAEMRELVAGCLNAGEAREPSPRPAQGAASRSGAAWPSNAA